MSINHETTKSDRIVFSGANDDFEVDDVFARYMSKLKRADHSLKTSSKVCSWLYINVYIFVA